MEMINLSLKNNRELQLTSVQVLSYTELHRALTNIYCYMF